MKSLYCFRFVAASSVLLLTPLAACPPVEPPVQDAGDDAGAPPPPPDGGQPLDAGPPPDAPAPDPVCGDGVVEAGEQCDDQNQSQTDSCKNDCTYNVCGDGYVYEGYEECDEGDTENNDGCSAACLFEPPPLPEYVTLQGVVRDRKYLAAPPYQNNVTVRAINAGTCYNNPTCTSGPSGADGAYNIPGLPPQSALVVEIRYPETYGAGTEVPGGFATRAKAATKAAATETANVYVVKYGWLAQTAYECGVYDTVDTALGNPDFVTYSAVFGQLKDQNGNGVGGINKARLEVQIGAYTNDTVTRNNTSYFCWLEAYDDDQNPATPEKYRGTVSDTSYATGGGAFVIFKAKNELGLGNGTQYVRVKQDPQVPNFAEQSVPVQAGMVSVVTLYTADDVPPPPPVLVDFNTDIYPVFNNAGCLGCHATGGPGAVYADPANQAYPADFSGSPDDVYANLVGAGTACGPPQDPNNPRDPQPTTYRVCVDYPKRAKLATKPLLEDPPNHPNASFPDENDPTLLLIEAWMEQGAQRYAVPPVEPPLAYSLEGVMRVSTERGCNACHGYNTGYAGGLSLDGCIQGLIDDGTYQNAGVETDPATNPNYKRDCVYYHLKNQGVADDPYGYGYRVDPNYPERSMLLRNPYCGPTYCAQDPMYPETHPVRVFPSTEDPSYEAMFSWIEGGALNNSDEDL